MTDTMFQIGQMVKIVADDNKEFVGRTGHVTAIQAAFWTARNIFPVEVAIHWYDKAVKTVRVETRWYRVRDLEIIR